MTYRVAMEKPRKSSGKGPIVEPKLATMDRPARSRLLDRVRDRIRVKKYTFRPSKLTSMGFNASSISMASGTARGRGHLPHLNPIFIDRSWPTSADQ
jgi:hypothetical protein